MPRFHGRNGQPYKIMKITSLNHQLIPTGVLLLTLLCANARATDILEVNGQGNNDANSSGVWGGTPSGGNNYIMTLGAGSGTGSMFGLTGINGRVRFSNANETFTGGSLTVSPLTEVLLKGQAQNGSVFDSANFIMNGGVIRWGPNGALGTSTNVLQGTMNVTANSYLVSARVIALETARYFDINATITGSGGLTLLSGNQADLTSSTTNAFFVFNGNLSAYNGTLTLGNGTLAGEYLDLNPSSTSMAGVTIDLASTDATTTLQLDSALTVAGLTIGSNVIGPGTYDAGALNALGDGGNFTGAGSLTIAPVPEPSTLAMMGSGLLGLIAVWKRSKQNS